MPTARVRGEMQYAWKGPSLLIVPPDGRLDGSGSLSGFYYREARYLRLCDVTINGARPWLCEAATLGPTSLTFTDVHPELTAFGGGGTGQSTEEESTDADGLPHRALTITRTYTVRPHSLLIEIEFANHARRPLTFDPALVIGADFVDIQDAFPPNTPQPRAPVDASIDNERLLLAHRHEQLPYRCVLSVTSGRDGWEWGGTSLSARLTLGPHQCETLRLVVLAEAIGNAARADEDVLEGRAATWSSSFTRIRAGRNQLADAVLAANVRDFASFACLEGAPDEWLSLQAGMPLYPALFGRDTLTAGWQGAFLDRGTSLDASLTTLARRQSTRRNDWRDEEPGRIPYQVRRGPQAILDINPYSAYYADYASPLMFVISLGHLYSWSGQRSDIERHYDTARRILDWAATDGDKDGDGYLEYQTRSPKGTKNQGWKDSGDAIVYDDGTPVPSPIATCELQGYWFAAQQLMSVLSAAMGALGDARAYWQSAMALKERFNRDWWVADERSLALAMDPRKELVRAVTSNIGHCIATGIVSDEHLPPLVGRMFAPDMFSGWGIRTLSSTHQAYNPISYHCGSVWAVEQATTAFGLRRFGFDARATDLLTAMFELASIYPGYRIPECVGGWSRAERPTPAAYPRANTPQLWNASSFLLLLHTVLGLQPVAPLNLLVVDPVLPTWLPDIVLEDIRLGDTVATLRFWRDDNGRSHAEVLRQRGPLHLVHQPPPESLTARASDRFAALFDSVVH